MSFGKKRKDLTHLDLYKAKEEKSYLQRRKGERLKALKSVLVVYNNGVTCEGIMRSMSYGGASVELFDVVHLPELVTIKSLHPDVENWEQDCKVIWKKNLMIGLQFV